MQQLKRLIEKIDKRSRWRVLGSYVLASIIAYQVIVDLKVGLRLPDWFPPLAVVLFIAGLPIVVAVTLIRESGTSEEPGKLIVLPESKRGIVSASGLRRAFTWRNALLGFVSAFAVWGVVATVWLVLGTQATGDSDGVMLAVLPVENLGSPEDEYFADGITEELTSRLAQLPQLGVISRTSAVQYKDTEKNAKQIGEELGVQYLLEGSVRWDKTSGDKSRIRVTPQLIRVADDRHVWAQRYEAVLAQIFEIQADIAESVAEALAITLVGNERQDIKTAPTQDLDAYDYYMRAHQVVNMTQEELAASIWRLEKAVELDPAFALAHAKLSIANMAMYFQGFDRTDLRLRRAKEPATRSLELDAGLPEGHFALGLFHQFGTLDVDRAIEEFKAAERGMPNNSFLRGTIATALRQRGDWDESAEGLEKAARLNPRDPWVFLNLGINYHHMRRYEQAELNYNRALSLDSTYVTAYTFKADLYVGWLGDTQAARQVLEGASSKVNAGSFNNVLIQLDILDRAYDAAIDKLAKSDVVTFYTLMPRLRWLMGDHGVARAYYDSLRIGIEPSAKDDDNIMYAGLLAEIYASLGREREARAFAEKTIRLASKDAADGPGYIELVARTYLKLGDEQQAMDKLEYLLSIPSSFSANTLRLDPTWDPLRDHPRFQALLEKYDTEQ